ncbi:hypothetical protein CEXT_334411 [Caerostris extrusa]|uniref:Uncharacterized protein n=1 Tax=Caerostris extrusa TaxID=172846 RepID=A0AAV4XJF6_CAEEX|nr:hypothetical protein CEXT_334411 [Caerostris extrusa]
MNHLKPHMTQGDREIEILCPAEDEIELDTCAVVQPLLPPSSLARRNLERVESSCFVGVVQCLVENGIKIGTLHFAVNGMLPHTMTINGKTGKLARKTNS